MVDPNSSAAPKIGLKCLDDCFQEDRTEMLRGCLRSGNELPRKDACIQMIDLGLGCPVEDERWA